MAPAEKWDDREERDQFVRMLVQLEGLTNEVKRLTEKIELMASTQVAVLGTKAAVHDEKINRLEKIVYGCITGIVAEFVALAAGFIFYFVSR